MDDDRQGQAGDVGVEEAVKAAADAIIVERGELIGTEPEEFGDMPRGPLADAVERLTRDQKVLQQEQQPGGCGDARSPVLAWEMVLEDGLEAEPLEEAVEDGEDTD